MIDALSFVEFDFFLNLPRTIGANSCFFFGDCPSDYVGGDDGRVSDGDSNNSR
jgi:hypothetical protein